MRHMEVEALVSSSTICRKHGALQESLASVTYLSDIVQQCRSVGLDIEATAQHEVASVLWEQGEAETSIRMRQHLIDHANFDSQASDISLPVLLAKLVSMHSPRLPSVANLIRVITSRKPDWQSPIRSSKNTWNQLSVN
jgi:hypothetical protein